jgi:hypothetical protein
VKEKRTELAEQTCNELSDTAGCKSVKNFDTPGCRIASDSYSRQYEEGLSRERAVRTDVPHRAILMVASGGVVYLWMEETHPDFGTHEPPAPVPETPDQQLY